MRPPLLADDKICASGVYPRERFSSAETTPWPKRREENEKAVSLLLTLILTLSLCTPVWADNTGTVKSVSALAVVGTATEEDLATAKAFLSDTGVFVYYEAGEMANQIMPRGTNFGQQNYKDVTTEAVKKYNALGDGVKAILETLYVTDGMMPCFLATG